jgi:hypothetical protein
MKTNLKNLLLASAILAVTFVPALCPAQDTQRETGADILFAEDVNDPMFNRYVDFDMIGWAWSQQDPVLLTDCALELAEAERVLLRKLKTVNSDELLKKAIALASDQREVDTLDRIATYATAVKKNDLLAAAISAKRLAGEERSVAPVLAVNLITMPMEKIAVLKALVGEIDKARANGNKMLLKVFSDEFPRHKELNEMYEKQEIAALKKYADESEKIAAESDATAKDTEDTLDRLAGEERKGLTAQESAAVALLGAAIVGAAIQSRRPQTIYVHPHGGHVHPGGGYNPGIYPAPPSDPWQYNPNVAAAQQVTTRPLYNNAVAPRAAQPRSHNGVRAVAW